jgi:hypothetical protein
MQFDVVDLLILSVGRVEDDKDVIRAPARSKGARVRVHNLAPFGQRGDQGGGGGCFNRIFFSKGTQKKITENHLAIVSRKRLIIIIYDKKSQKQMKLTISRNVCKFFL